MMPIMKFFHSNPEIARRSIVKNTFIIIVYMCNTRLVLIIWIFDVKADVIRLFVKTMTKHDHQRRKFHLGTYINCLQNTFVYSPVLMWLFSECSWTPSIMATTLSGWKTLPNNVSVSDRVWIFCKNIGHTTTICNLASGHFSAHPLPIRGISMSSILTLCNLVEKTKLSQVMRKLKNSNVQRSRW